MNISNTPGTNEVAETALLGSILTNSSPNVGASRTLWNLNDFSISPSITNSGDSSTAGNKIDRPTSAPPSNLDSSLFYYDDSNNRPNAMNPRMQQEYSNYYHANRNLNPRLPSPKTRTYASKFDANESFATNIPPTSTAETSRSGSVIQPDSKFNFSSKSIGKDDRINSTSDNNSQPPSHNASQHVHQNLSKSKEEYPALSASWHGKHRKSEGMSRDDYADYHPGGGSNVPPHRSAVDSISASMANMDLRNDTIPSNSVHDTSDYDVVKVPRGYMNDSQRRMLENLNMYSVPPSSQQQQYPPDSSGMRLPNQSQYFNPMMYPPYTMDPRAAAAAYYRMGMMMDPRFAPDPRLRHMPPMSPQQAAIPPSSGGVGRDAALYPMSFDMINHNQGGLSENGSFTHFDRHPLFRANAGYNDHVGALGGTNYHHQDRSRVNNNNNNNSSDTMHYNNTNINNSRRVDSGSRVPSKPYHRDRMHHENDLYSGGSASSNNTALYEPEQHHSYEDSRSLGRGGRHRYNAGNMSQQKANHESYDRADDNNNNYHHPNGVKRGGHSSMKTRSGNPSRPMNNNTRSGSDSNNGTSTVSSITSASSSSGSNAVATVVDPFKTKMKNRKLEFRDITGKIVEFSQDQHGSRFIQQKLEGASIEEKNLVFDEIYDESLNLMTDVFGNYVIQKIFDHGTETHHAKLVEKLKGHVVDLSMQMYGCRVVQKALESTSSEADIQVKLVRELQGHVMRCVKDQNANHVIQKCLVHSKPPAINFIIEAFSGHIYELATHPNGCRVIQRILENCEDISLTMPLLKEILKCAESLVQDQYGNYVIQHVLQHGDTGSRERIIEKIGAKILHFAQHKFASNVVEKCVEYGSHGDRRGLVVIILTPDIEGVAPLEIMMKDPYANYVVQKLMDICDDDQRDAIFKLVKAHAIQLKKFTYGKHILNRVERLESTKSYKM